MLEKFQTEATETQFHLAMPYVATSGGIDIAGAYVFGVEVMYGSRTHMPVLYNRWTGNTEIIGTAGHEILEVSADSHTLLMTNGLQRGIFYVQDRLTDRQFSLLPGTVLPDSVVTGVRLSSDGKTVAIQTRDADYNQHIWTAKVDFDKGQISADSLTRVTVDTETLNTRSGLSISSDGSSLCYESFVDRILEDGDGNPSHQTVSLMTRVNANGSGRITLDRSAPDHSSIISWGGGGNVIIREVYDDKQHYLRTIYETLTSGRSGVLHSSTTGTRPTEYFRADDSGRYITHLRENFIDVISVATGETRSIALDGRLSEQGSNAILQLGVTADGLNITFFTGMYLSPEDQDPTPDWYLVNNPFNEHPVHYPSEYADALIGTDGRDVWYMQAGDDTVDAMGGDDLIGGGMGNDTLMGGDGADLLYGGLGDDRLYGDAGDDILFGDQREGEYLNDGHDSLWGGTGNDRLYGDNGNDELFGEDGQDLLFGGQGQDYLSGGDGDDELYGEEGDDQLDGGAGNDAMSGGDGDDILRGGDGNDVLFGDNGADRFFLDAGNDAIHGGDDDDAVDVLVLKGSPSDYLIIDHADQGHRTAVATVESSDTGRDLVHGVELAEFESLRSNVATVDNLYLTLAGAADVAYSNDLTLGDGWATLSAMELGIPMVGEIEGNLTRWVYANGVYSAVNDRVNGELEAAAHVYFGVVDGKNTVLLAFRGTDTLLTDGQDYPQMRDHYARFAPLVKALLAYVNTGGHTPNGTIDQVLVSGHSLGGAMVQLFMQDDRVYGDPRFNAATFGSPFAELARPDDRVIHFEHSGDPIPLAADAVQALNGLPGISLYSRLAHWLSNQQNVLDFEPVGGVVRIVTDTSVGQGLSQHSMPNYVESIRRMAAQPDLYPFIETGSAGVPASGHTYVAVGSDAADEMVGDDPLIINLLRGAGYFGGNEVFAPGKGADTVTGNGGKDVIRGTAAELNLDTITDFGQGDIIRIKGDFAQGDLYHQSTGIWSSTLQIGSATTINLRGRYDGSFYVVAHADGYTDIGYSGDWISRGSNDDDVLAGSDGNDTIHAGGGNDRVSGGGGDDQLSGGSGTDWLMGGDGDDVLVGGARSAGALAAAGSDSDVLDGGLGSDRMIGGDGADVFVIGSDATDYILDFSQADGDRIDISGVLQAMNWDQNDVNPFAGGFMRLMQSGDDVLIRFDADGSAGRGAAVTVARVRDIQVSTLGADDFYAGSVSISPERTMTARFATDEMLNLQGTGKNDTLIGNDSSNRLDGGAGDDELVGRAGDDLLFGALGNDRLFGGDGDDDLRGGVGNDELHGGSGVNILRGGDGDDLFFSGSGADDQWFGGAGNDRFVIAAEPAVITIRDFEKGDILDLSAHAFETVQDVLDSLYTDWQGNTRLILGEGTQVYLNGVSADQLDASNITLTPVNASLVDPVVLLSGFLM